MEGAASGELHRHLGVGVQLKQVKAWNRRSSYIWFDAIRAEPALAVTPLNGFDEHWQGDFTLVEDLVIRQFELGRIWGGTSKRASHGDGNTALVGFADLSGHIGLLHDHSGDHHQLGPVPLGFADLAHVAVNQLHFP